jgi:RND family efflux transporter MFP subunit
MFSSLSPCLLVLQFFFGSCGKSLEKPPLRPVRTIVVRHALVGEPIKLTGRIQAQNTVNLAFRIGGRLVERNVDVGDIVTPGQIVARLEPQDEQNALLAARADLSATQGMLVQARAAFQRQSDLLSSGFTSQAQYDQTLQQLQSAQAQADSAAARLKTAQDNLGYTDLRSDAAGAVTAKEAEPGEVVSAGQMILQVARDGGRDAVFNVPAQLIRRAPSNLPVTVALSDDPAISVQGRVREVAPQADATIGTYLVKVELIEPPETMRLGATVTGSAIIDRGSLMPVPATALMQIKGKPAVWIVDEKNKTVALHAVNIQRYDPAQLLISDGLSDGDIVVTAGVQALHPGEEVRLLGTPAADSP